MSDGEAELARVLGALRPEVTIDGLRGTARYEPQPEHRGFRGLLHGGFAAALLDHVCARVAGHALEQRVVTGTLDLRYPQPVPLDGGPYDIEAEADAARSGRVAPRRLVKVSGAILDRHGRPMVEARGLFVANEQRPG